MQRGCDKVLLRASTFGGRILSDAGVRTIRKRSIGERSGLAHGGLEFARGTRRETAGALQAHQSQRQANAHLVVRKNGGGEVFEGEQGGSGSVADWYISGFCSTVQFFS